MSSRAVRAGIGVLGSGALALVLAAPSAVASSGGAPGGSSGPGHVRVDTTPEDDRVTPQPATCDVALRLSGYAEGAEVAVEFSVKAPQHGERTTTDGGVHLASDDAAGSRTRDADAVLQFTADQLDLSGARPHHTKGYRVTVTVDALGDGHGPRLQQFWLLPCDGSEPVQPVEPVDSAEPAEPVDSAEPTEPGDEGPTQPGDDDDQVVDS